MASPATDCLVKFCLLFTLIVGDSAAGFFKLFIPALLQIGNEGAIVERR